MGWYADTDWDLTFNDDEALQAVTEIASRHYREGWGENADADCPVEVMLLSLFNAEVSAELEGLRLTGNGWDKAWDVGPDHAMSGPYNVGGLGYYTEIAPYVTGTIDWSSEDHLWRVRFRNGSWAAYPGKVIYPDDREG